MSNPDTGATVVLVLSVEVSSSMVPPGGDVAVLGSSDIFGAWNAAKAVPMVPRWQHSKGGRQEEKTKAQDARSPRTCRVSSGEPDLAASCPVSPLAGPGVPELQTAYFDAVTTRAEWGRPMRETWELRVQLPVCPLASNGQTLYSRHNSRVQICCPRPQRQHSSVGGNGSQSCGVPRHFNARNTYLSPLS